MLLFPTHIFELKVLKHYTNNKDIYLYDFRESDTPIRQKFHDDCISYYKQYLKENGYKLTVTNKLPDDIAIILDPVNKDMRKKLKAKYPNLDPLDTPSFLLNFKTKKVLRFASFYKKAMKVLGITFDKSYDKMNRETSIKHTIPEVKIKIGTTHKEANSILNEFIKERYKLFGPYQDVIKPGYVFHSNISHLLNVGLLLPGDVTKKVSKVKVPINSKEGFFRQLIWREYMRYLYEHLDFNNNMFGAKNKLSKVWWTAETGIDFIDDAIKQLNETGYNHHIQRLMVLGNSFLLLGIDPEEALKWFMQYIDAYDWVMRGNIVMALHTEPIFTKPYFSSSNYISKMSDYKRNEDFDLLYQNFVNKHYDYLKSHGRTFAKKREIDNVRLKELEFKLLKRGDRQY